MRKKVVFQQESNLQRLDYRLTFKINIYILSKKAFNFFTQFPSTYCCEVGFSSMVFIKTKYRNLLDIDDIWDVFFPAFSLDLNA